MRLSEEKLDLDHFDEIDPLIKQLQAKASEYSFANLYLFRRKHDYRVVRHGRFVFVEGVTYDEVHYLMPLSPLEEIGMDALRELMSKGVALFPILEKDLHLFPESDYEYAYNLDESDFIFTRDKIENYPGRKLHKKRNLVSQHKNLHKYEVTPYSCDFQDDAKNALERWFEISGAPLEGTDYVPSMEALEHCRKFGLFGQIYHANGEPSGFLLGEGLTEDMYVIHFAKGVTTYKGIYEHMYSSLAASLPVEFTLINFEQDLGLLPLRRAKTAYLPDEMLHKYRVKLKR